MTYSSAPESSNNSVNNIIRIIIIDVMYSNAIEVANVELTKMFCSCRISRKMTI